MIKSKFILGLVLVLSGHCHAAIVYPKEPDGGRQMVIGFASDFVGKNLPPFKEINSTDDLTFAPPLREYESGDLTKGQLLTGATSGRDGWQSWKYIFLQGTNVIGEAYLEADQNTGKSLKCTSVGSSAFSKEIGTALQEAEQSSQVQKQDYEARLLDNHLVSFYAVWLHGKSNDFIIPLPSGTYNRMNAYQLYSESQIIQILEPEAKRDSAMWAKLEKQRQHDNDAYAKAMTDYEKAHGGKCGSISLYSLGVIPDANIYMLQGISSQCGKLNYKVKVTYAGRFENVEKVEILEKMAQ